MWINDRYIPMYYYTQIIPQYQKYCLYLFLVIVWTLVFSDIEKIDLWYISEEIFIILVEYFNLLILIKFRQIIVDFQS